MCRIFLGCIKLWLKRGRLKRLGSRVREWDKVHNILVCIPIFVDFGVPLTFLKTLFERLFITWVSDLNPINLLLFVIGLWANAYRVS